MDSGDTKSVAGVAFGTQTTTSGSVGNSVSGNYGAIVVSSNGSYTYTVDNSNSAVQALRTSGNTLQEIFSYTVVDNAGLSSTTQLTITIQGVNDTPIQSAFTRNAISEDASIGTVLTTISAADVDAGDTKTFSLTNDAGGRFAIDSVTGVITVIANLNYETNSYHDIVVRVADTAGATNDQSIRVFVENSNTRSNIAVSATVTASSQISSQYSPDAVNDQVIGRPGPTSGEWASTESAPWVQLDWATPQDIARIVLFDRPGGDNITGGTLQFSDGSTVAFGGLPGDGQTPLEIAFNPRVVSWVRVNLNGTSSNAGLAEIQAFTSHAPVAADDTATAVEAGGVANGTPGNNPSGNVLTNDTDGDSVDTQTIVGVASGNQVSASGSVGASVNGNFGAIQIAANGAYTYTVDNSNPTVQALRTTANTLSDVFTYTLTDAAGFTSTAQITVTIEGSNDTPTITSNGGGTTASISVAENIAAVTSVTSLDVDAGTTLTYSISGGVDAARFSIDSSNGTLVFVSAPDFEAPNDVGNNNIYDVIVRVSDGTLFTTQAIAVTVTDVSNFLFVTTAVDNNDSAITSGANYNIEWLNANQGADAAISLREAIIAANNTAGTDTIDFNIAGSGVKTINVSSALPVITGSIIIDGYSQSGSSANTLATGNNSVLNVVLNGATAGVGVNGLNLDSGSSGSEIRGLVIQGFSGSGIFGQYSNSHTIAGNWIGVSSDGTTAAGNGAGGIILNFSDSNTIGGSSTADRNVISGNTGVGVTLSGQGSLILNNYIGTNAAGTADLGNSSHGVLLNGFGSHTIGGAGSQLRNVISGNDGSGIYSSNSGYNTIQGNFIGLNAAGTLAIANGTSGQNTSGISIYGGTPQFIGGTAAGSGNVISGNLGNKAGGILLSGVSQYSSMTPSIQVYGNLIGTDATGSTAVGNQSAGLYVENSSSVAIGGTTTAHRNVISGNQDGIVFAGASTVANTIQGNYIGTNSAGTGSIGNSRYGVWIGSSATANFVGGSVAGSGNLISGNSDAGVYLTADSNTVSGNYIGLNATGSNSLANAKGIVVEASSNTIGGTTAQARNIVSGNTGYGIHLNSGTNNSVIGNYVGTNATGTTGVANQYGIVLDPSSSGNYIGGAAAGQGNVVSGNSITGVYVNSANNSIAGNLIGVNAAGTAGVANQYGLWVNGNGTGNTIGGATAGAGNVISGNSSYGVYLAGASNTISGNTIGLNAAGTASIANSYGVYINNASNNTIGGTTSLARNIISGNSNDGVHITGAASTNNIVQGNYIGTNATGGAAIGNGAMGIRIGGAAAGNTVGGTAAGSGNLISGNLNSGVYIDASNTTVQGNLIGTNAAGTGALANGSNGSATGGVYIASGTGSLIGGTSSSARNVLSGNGGAGVWIEGTTGSHTIQGNYIGVDITGDNALGNNRWGIVLNAGTITNVLIGGTAIGAGNVISASGGGSGGVYIASASGTILEGNRIGIGANTTTALGAIQASGISVTSNAVNTRIGGSTAAASNIIARNGSSGGVVIWSNAVGTSVLRNQIFGNTGIGIDLGNDGPTNNDGNQTSGQGNLLTDKPVLSNANLVGTNLTLAGYVGSAPGQGLFANARVEFFKITSSASVYLGNLTTDANGNFSGDLDVSGLGLADSDQILATATDGAGNTSEFSIPFVTNTSPTATPDTALAVEAGGVSNGTVGTNPTGNVLNNDTDPTSGDSLSVVGVGQGVASSVTGFVNTAVAGSYGTITLAANGSFSYVVDNSNASVQALRTTGQTLTDVFTYTISDAGGLTSTTQLTVTIDGRNDAPHDLSASGLTIAENSANGTSVAIITPSDVDGSDTFTFQLNNDASGRFAIDTNTGEITVINSSLLNYESASSHQVSVRTIDASGAFYDEWFTITLTDVNEFAVSSITDSNAATTSVNENATIGSLVGLTAFAFDSDGTNNTVTYTLVDDDGGNFTIDANTGIVSTAATLDREVLGPSRDITVRATSADGSTTTAIFSVAINDIDEFNTTTPIDTDTANDSVAENASIGTAVGITAFATDDDATTSGITYSLFNNDGGRFTINAATGEVTVAAALNRESDGPTRNIIVRAISADGSFADQSYTINLEDVDEFDVTTPTDSDASTNLVNENAVSGTSVGLTIAASDADATNSLVSFQLDDNANGRFTIDSLTGIVSVADGTMLDFETTTSHDIIVRATSADGSFRTQTFTIQLADVNESGVSAITDNNASNNTVLENSAPGSVVGITAFAFDADGTDSVTYTLADDAGGLFAIDNLTGVVTVVGAIDRESAASYAITVRATSTDASNITETFTITIGDLDEFNTSTVADTDTSLNSVAENAAVGALVGISGFAFDADATNNAIVYSLIDNSGGRFQIDANTGVVTVAGSIDRETDGNLRTITVRATSQDGSFDEQNFSISIVDVDEYDATTPVDNDPTANFVMEDASVFTLVGVTALSTDADATTNSVTYSLDDNANGRFAIDSVTGVVTVQAPLDREANASYTIVVRALSADGSSATQSFQIQVGDVDEFDVGPVSDGDNQPNTVVENAAIGSTVGLTGSALDADSTNSAITYTLTNNPDGLFQIDGNSGIVTTAVALDRELHGSTRSITIRATSADGSFSEQSFSVAIEDADEFDVGVISDNDLSTNQVSENAMAGTHVGITASALDSDATNNTLVYSLVDDDGGRFAIDSNTGVVTVAGAIDRESDGPSRNITVRATSADGSFTDQSFSIQILDIDEFDVLAVTDADTTTNQVSENATVGTAVGLTAAAQDLDATNNTVTYTLVDSDGGRFAIDSGTGVVTVAVAINREVDGPVRTITVRGTSADGSFIDQVFTISILDVNETPVSVPLDIDAASNSIDENQPAGTWVGLIVQSNDLDVTNNQITYSLDDSAGGRFAIDPNTGLVSSNASLDFEAFPSHRITVRATSTDGSFATADFTIAVNNINERPTGSGEVFTTTYADTINISAPGLIMNNSDPEGDAMFVSLVSGPSTGLLIVQSDGSFSYKPTITFIGQVSFSYIVSDGALNSAVETVVINVTQPSRHHLQTGTAAAIPAARLTIPRLIQAPTTPQTIPTTPIPTSSNRIRIADLPMAALRWLDRWLNPFNAIVVPIHPRRTHQHRNPSPTAMEMPWVLAS